MAHSRIDTLSFLVIALALAAGCKGREAPIAAAPELPTCAMVVEAIDDAGGRASVVVERDGAKAPIDASQGEKLLPSDRVTTGEGIRALVRLESGDRIALRAGSSVKVLSSTALVLEQGEILVDGALSGVSTGLRVTAGPASLKMEAAFASVSLAGKDMRLAFVSGSGVISTASRETIVQGGQEAVIDDRGAVVVHSLFDAGSLFGWSDALRAPASVPGETDLGAQASLPTGRLGSLSAKAPGGKAILPFEMVSQDVQVGIQDSVAVTRIEQVFVNPTSQVVEGTYRFPVPPGARLTRFDMEIGGKLMPGEIVERERGRAILRKVIDDYLWLMRDPALVEWESGSTFKTRIFPIKAKETKRIVLSYIQTLQGQSGRYRYVLPLAGPGAPTIPSFHFAATVASSAGTPVLGLPLYAARTEVKDGKAVVDVETRDFTPPADLVIDIEQPGRPQATLATFGPEDTTGDQTLADAMQKAGKADPGGDYFMLTFTPEITDVAPVQGKADDWIILVDTSRSRTPLDMQVERDLVDTLVASLSFHDRVRIMTYDVQATSLGDGWERPSWQSLERLRTMLDEATPGGATDISEALRAASLLVEGQRRTRILLVGDGAPTLGELSASRLADQAAALIEGRDVTFATIGVGSSMDSLVLEQIAHRTGGKYVQISPGENLLATATSLVATIRAPVIEQATVSVSGLDVTDLAPSTLGSLSSGEEVTVTGRFHGTGTAVMTLSGKVAGKDYTRQYSFEVGEAGGKNGFVPLIWASHRLDALDASDEAGDVDRAVELSKRFAIPCRHTSFIVLENQAMYEEFHVEHQDDRYEWEGTEGVQYEDASDDIDEPFSGGDGKIGNFKPSAIMGGGSAEGMAMVGIPDLEPLGTTYKVEGHITLSNVVDMGGTGLADMDAVQRQIRKRLPAIKFCYELGLKKNPDIRGKIILKFTVDATGRVSESSVSSDTLGDAIVSACIAAKLKTLSFEKPEGGSAHLMIAMALMPGAKTPVDYSPSYTSSWKTVPLHTASIITLPPRTDMEGKISDLKQKTADEPLSRRHRKDLVDILIKLGRFGEAAEQVEAWSKMDPANPTVLVYQGDLARMKGDLAGALRFYSGVLDLDPADTRMMDTLASFFECHGQWSSALPYRLAAHLVEPTKPARTAQLAVALALAGDMDAATRTAASLMVQSASGYKPAKGVKLAPDTLSVLESILAKKKLPDGHGVPVRDMASKVSALLTWKGDADLDLWISTTPGSHVGGPWDKGVLASSASGVEGELFTLPEIKTGRYKVQVICASESGCKGTAATLEMKVLDKQETVLLLFDDSGWGLQPVIIKVDERYSLGI